MAESQQKRSQGQHSSVIVALAGMTALDLVHIHLLSSSTWPPGAPLLWLSLLLWAWAFGSALVIVVAASSTAVHDLGAWLQRFDPLRRRPATARALAVALVTAPAAASIAWSLFQGRGITSRHATIAAVGPFVTAPLLMLLITLGFRLLEWLRRRGRALRTVAAMVGGLVVFALFFVDARLFVGLYQDLHLALSLTALWLMVTLARAAAPDRAGSGPATRKGRLRWLGFALLSASIALGALVGLLRAAPQTRADLIERSLYASRGVSLLAPLLPLGAAPELETTELTFDEVEREYLRGLVHAPAGASKRPDILLFSIDAVNADRFPGRGYSEEVMPQIAKLVPRGIRFDKAYTTIPETQYALPGLIMSTTREMGPAAAVRESGETIASALRRVGYGTYWVYEAQDLFQGGGVLNNLDFEGFDGRFGIDDNRPFASSERVIELLESQQGRPVFIWTHLFAPHAPYDPPEQFRRFGTSRSDLYDGELLASDTYVGRVLDYLRDQGRLEDTIVIITADHGEWSGEGGRFGHGADVTERTINIPLLFTGPGIDPGVVVQTPVSMLDIAPTVVDLGGGEIPESFEGESLVPALRGGELDHSPVLAYTHGRGSTAALLDDYKLVFNRNKTVIRLYNLAHDREENRDLASADQARVREMLARVAVLDLDRTVAERIEEEGADQALDHYRDLVLDQDLPEAERTLAARALGHIDEGGALGALLGLLERGAVIPLSIRRWLAHSLARLGAGDQVEATWQLAATDADPMVRVLAVRALRDTSRAAEAIEQWADADDVHLRRAAASIVTSLSGRTRLVEGTSEELLNDDDPLVRALAVSNLARLRVADRPEVIERALDDVSAQVRLAGAEQCGRASRGCLEAVLRLVSRTEDIGERLALLGAVTPALNHQPERWAQLLDGPPAQRALAYQGLGRTDGDFDELLLHRFDQEHNDRAREALIRAAGQRRLQGARSTLIAQHGGDNFALGQAATDALRRIGLRQQDVPELLRVFPRASQVQTKVNLLHLFGTIDQIDDPRVFELAEQMRATPMKDHHLIRALVEVYSRLTHPEAQRFRIDHVMYTNFGYQFWLYGYSLTPERPAPGEEVRLKTVWSIRWNQRANVRNFIHLVGGPRQVPINRRTMAGRPIHRWPRCRIMVDEVTLQMPSPASRVRIMTGWFRGGRRYPVVYGEHDDQRRALITEIELASER